MLKKHYGALMTRIPTEDGREWTILNVHLSAFDDGGMVRAEQVSALIEMVEAEYRRGAHVVVGGDWNMRLVDTSFPHATEERFLSWIHDFPHETVPEGWTFAIDASVASVRTLHRPYEAGVNYVTVVDGFLVSPNVTIERGRDRRSRIPPHRPSSGSGNPAYERCPIAPLSPAGFRVPERFVLARRAVGRRTHRGVRLRGWTGFRNGGVQGKACRAVWLGGCRRIRRSLAVSQWRRRQRPAPFRRCISAVPPSLR